MVDMIAANEINGKQAKEIFIKMLDGERGTIHEIADKYGMKQITDTGAIENAVDEVIKNNPAQVEQYKSGKVGLLGFFVGNVMKATKGQANPAMVSDLLKQKLGQQHYVVFCSDLTQEQKENLAYWIRVLSANTVDPESLFVVQDDETTIKNLEQKFAKEIEQKNKTKEKDTYKTK